MADIPQVLATYDALVGVALGAGLTYGFSALSRRHQEAREDKTRWYQARLAAYTEFYQALSDGWLPVGAKRRTDPKAVSRLRNALGLIQLVGSMEVCAIALALFGKAENNELGDGQPRVATFLFLARKDLGDTLDYRSIQRDIDRDIEQAFPLDEDD
jgi:hypothetical protein